MNRNPPLMLTHEPWSDIESRQTRSQAQHQARQSPQLSGAHNALMAEMKAKALDIQRHSATRSAATSDAETHNKYVASLLNTPGGHTHQQFAEKRYGQHAGRAMLETLHKLGPGMEDLIADPALMSKSHLEAFSAFAGKTAKKRGEDKLAPLSPWAMRKHYEDSLGREDWYRGLKLDDTMGQGFVNTGIQPRVTRTLDSMNKSDGKRGVFVQLFNPRQGDQLPALDEAFDKPFADVIEHRVNKPARSEGRDYQGRQFSRNNADFQASLRPWAEVPEDERKERRLPNLESYYKQEWSRYDNRQKALKTAHGKRLEDESITQSVTQFPEVGIGFGGSDLFGGGKPGPNQHIFNYRMNLSPLEVIKPQDWVPEQRMSSGVQVENVKIPNSARLESLLIGQVPARRITGVTAHTAAQIPKFSALE